MNIAQALDLAPPTPACFPDRDAWAGYLLSVHQLTEHSRHASGPFGPDGRYRPVFNFCTDCEPGHAARMRMSHKCKPGMFRSIPIVRAPAEAPA